ncbi:MAG: hypothetical protein JJE49_01510 [Peptostreptococcaceae bacterium]|nr:hypothetical protein [Peptostreptococcaceae bacterium]
MRDKSKLTVGIVFLLGSVYFLVNLLTKEMESYFISGMIVCAISGIAFIRNSKR